GRGVHPMRRRILASDGGVRGVRTRTRRPRAESLEDRRLLAILTVNTTSDSNSPTDPALSLRQAIEVSNGTLPVSSLSPQQRLQVAGALSSPSPNTIDFDIPAADPGYRAATQTWLIAPGSSLPTVTAPVVINGYSQPGASANTNRPGLGKST